MYNVLDLFERMHALHIQPVPKHKKISEFFLSLHEALHNHILIKDTLKHTALECYENE